MQEFNPDVMAAMVRARQETLLKKTSTPDFRHTRVSARLMIGRALIRMGERLSGRHRLVLPVEVDGLPTAPWSVQGRPGQ